MIHRMLSHFAVMVIAVVGLGVSAGPVEAAGPRGGFHGGGFRGGFNGRVGGYYHPGYSHYGYYPYYGSYYRPYYGYGYYPYYPAYPSSSYGPATDPGTGSTADLSAAAAALFPPAVSSIPGAGNAARNGEEEADAPGTTSSADAPAKVTVRLPAGADLWFNNTHMTAGGTDRTFTSPPLARGRQFAYDVRARWAGQSGVVEQTQTVVVAAGGNVTVTFPVPPKPGDERKGPSATSRIPQ